MKHTQAQITGTDLTRRATGTPGQKAPRRLLGALEDRLIPSWVTLHTGHDPPLHTSSRAARAPSQTTRSSERRAGGRRARTTMAARVAARVARCRPLVASISAKERVGWSELFCFVYIGIPCWDVRDGLRGDARELRDRRDDGGRVIATRRHFWRLEFLSRSFTFFCKSQFGWKIQGSRRRRSNERPGVSREPKTPSVDTDHTPQES